MNTVAVTAAPSAGLGFERIFSKEGQDPFESVRWTKRMAVIRDDKGQEIFRQDDAEVPASYTDVSTNVVVSKYFYGDSQRQLEDGRPERESSVRQLVHRVARTITQQGISYGIFCDQASADIFFDELVVLLLQQYAAFNSPVWFNVGLYHQYGIQGTSRSWHWDRKTESTVKVQPGDAYKHPQGSACFIQSVTDDMEGIMTLATSEAMLFKYGSGTGTDLSTLRSSREKVSGGGMASGPVSFMQIYDGVASTVKSGGKTRRAAKMQSLKCTHPDILEFIEAKAKEERKAQALIAAGYDPDFNGEAYASVRYQNCNMSVRATGEFLRAADNGAQWQTVPVVPGTPVGEMPVYSAVDLMDKIATGTWACGDPGLQYEDTIQQWHTCPNTGPINASNPCSEFMFLDDTSCNLASLNLMKFRREDGSFDVNRYRAACRIMITAQEILVDHGSYPTPKIAENSHRFRPLGLGYCNLGALIMAMGKPYDSPEGRATCAALTAILTGQGYLTSAELASVAGPFEGFAENREPMLKVMELHRSALLAIDPGSVDHELTDIAWKVWNEVISAGQAHGYRNSQISVIAPTGTIAFMMGADTTGIEPEIGLVKYKNLAGGGQLKIVNHTVPIALEALRYKPEHITAILAHMEETGTIEGAPYMKTHDLPVFDCAFVPASGERSIPFAGHVKMMGAAQPFVSGAISKTCNLPADATVDQIRDAYLLGWKLGLKALAIFRDGSKGSQPVVMKQEIETMAATVAAAIQTAPYRRRLPDTRGSVTHKFTIDGNCEGYLIVGLYDDGTPGELFITMAKEGSTVGGLMDTIGTLISMGLQYGVPIGVYVDKFTYTRFDPSGFTKNPDIPIARSVVDYIFRWMGMRFIPGYREQNVPVRHSEDHFDVKPVSTTIVAGNSISNGVATMTASRLATARLTGPPCRICGTVMVPNGARCYRCDNCGNPGPCG
jgi:ribonucleoside-diphosphate reductase alpha chain